MKRYTIYGLFVLAWFLACLEGESGLFGLPQVAAILVAVMATGLCYWWFRDETQAFFEGLFESEDDADIL